MSNAPQNIANPPPVILALADWVRGNHVSEDALYRMQQFGFIFPNASGKLEITVHGQEALREYGLI